MMRWSKKHKVFNLQELQSLDSYFRKYTDDLNLVRVHGFITAIASFPDLFTPSEWIPILIDDIKFQKEKDVRMVLEGLMELYFQVVANLNSNQDFKFILSVCDMDLPLKDATLEQVKEWCSGYSLALMWNEDEWLDDEDDFVAQACATFFILSDIIQPDLPHDEQAKWTDDEKRKLADGLPELLKALYYYWMDDDEEYFEEFDEEYDSEIRPVYNRPCPCGSGKPYTKCCQLEVEEAILH